MTPTAEMRMAPSFPAPQNEKRLAEGGRQADVAAVGAEVRDDVGLFEGNLGDAVRERVERLRIMLLQRAVHGVEVALLLREQAAHAGDVVLEAGGRAESQEAVV